MAVLSDNDIKALIQLGNITSDNEGIETRISAASLDLTLSAEAYRAKYISKPRNLPMDRFVKETQSALFDTERDVLHAGQVGLFRLNEYLQLPQEICARANNKSTSGRLDLLARLVTPTSLGYNNLRFGFSGPLWNFISPLSFSHELPAQSSINQIRFYDSVERLSIAEIIALHEAHPLVWLNERTPIDDIRPLLSNDGAIQLPINIDSGTILKNPIIGFTPNNANISTLPPINIMKKGYKKSDYWKEVKANEDDNLLLVSQQFFLFNTLYHIAIPPTHAGEITAIDESHGDMRAHYAGFIDPGFGYPIANSIVLEMRFFENNVVLYNGDAVCYLYLQKMRSVPEHPYGSGKSTFTKQSTILLPKCFDC